MQNIYDLPDYALIRLEDVLKAFPVSKSRWHAGVAAHEYPVGIKIGPRMTAYRVSDIKALIERLAAASNEQA